jgi:flagellar biosynthesis protein FlhF
VRIKTFTAKTVAAAMADVRRELGRDAVIIQVTEATRKDPAKVVAAIEPTYLHARAESVIDTMPAITRTNWQHQLNPLLVHHGLSASLQNRLVQSLEDFDALDATAALTQSLGLTLAFRPVATHAAGALMLVGQSGQGKTLAGARLAAAAKSQSRAARIITLDGGSAGAMAQLDTFCGPLDIAVQGCTSEQLSALQLAEDTIFTLVDTAGINPYDLADIAALSRVLSRTHIEPVWVMSCGADTAEALEQARIFSALGVQRVIATHADSCRRFGSLLDILHGQALKLAGICDSPYMSDPVIAGCAGALAAKMLAVPCRAESTVPAGRTGVAA